MDWDSTTWEQFERALTEYRDKEFLGCSRISGENAYLDIVRELSGVPSTELVHHADSLVLFLNRWNCRLPTRTSETRLALQGWLGREQTALEALGTVTLFDSHLATRREEFDRLYASLIALRDSMDGARIPTMGDAAASKILHVIVTPLFVMWDKEIKRGGWGYGEFMLRMHEFAHHLRDRLAPAEARADIEGYLQNVLGYPVRKPLAKYIDEFNWWLAWGLGAQPALGRSSFTAAEIDELRRLVREKQTADSSRQKTLRARMRTIGFYVSDFTADPGGFVVSDLDALISRGTIAVSDDASPSPSPLAGGAPSAPRPEPDARAGPTASTDDRGSSDFDVSVRAALRALARAEARLFGEVAERVPRRPGLYAIHAPDEVWVELGLGEPPDERPLYVGKAERSLVSRDIDTHFGNGRTGSSTVRRSFAALLREPLELEGRPRNPARPERHANYGLSPEHDQKLTDWMRELALAVWPKPEEYEIALGVIETAVLRLLEPPLNLKDVVTPWTPQLKATRKAMTDQARQWSPDT